MVGAKGPVGPAGQAGKTGDHGTEGLAGQDGPQGPKGANFKYDLIGPSAFAVGLGGDRGMIHTGTKGLTFEHSESACQIRFVQKMRKEGKSEVPGIISGFKGNIGVGTTQPEKELHVMDNCKKTDAECANRDGPLMLSASWRNVVMAKVQDSHYDMIGAYTNWAKGTSLVYIAAHDQQALPVTKSFERVYFGGPDGENPPAARFENFEGKFYATKFVENVREEEASEVLKDADVFLDTAHTAKSVDLSHAHLALHAKVSHHKAHLGALQTEMDDTIAIAKKLKAKLSLSLRHK